MEPDPTVVYRDGDEPEPVTPTTPLTGLELDVLRVWKETSPLVRTTHRQAPLAVETAVRQAVWNALVEELRLKSQGLRPHEAEEFTRPAMWLPPTEFHAT